MLAASICVPPPRLARYGNAPPIRVMPIHNTIQPPKTAARLALCAKSLQGASLCVCESDCECESESNRQGQSLDMTATSTKDLCTFEMTAWGCVLRERRRGSVSGTGSERGSGRGKGRGGGRERGRGRGIKREGVNRKGRVSRASASPLPPALP